MVDSSDLLDVAKGRLKELKDRYNIKDSNVVKREGTSGLNDADLQLWDYLKNAVVPKYMSKYIMGIPNAVPKTQAELIENLEYTKDFANTYGMKALAEKTSAILGSIIRYGTAMGILSALTKMDERRSLGDIEEDKESELIEEFKQLPEEMQKQALAYAKAWIEKLQEE